MAKAEPTWQSCSLWELCQYELSQQTPVLHHTVTPLLWLLLGPTSSNCDFHGPPHWQETQQNEESASFKCFTWSMPVPWYVLPCTSERSASAWKTLESKKGASRYRLFGLSFPLAGFSSHRRGTAGSRAYTSIQRDRTQWRREKDIRMKVIFIGWTQIHHRQGRRRQTNTNSERSQTKWEWRIFQHCLKSAAVHASIFGQSSPSRHESIEQWTQLSLENWSSACLSAELRPSRELWLYESLLILL